METTARKRSLLLSTGILGEGLRLPALNPGLFAIVFALAVANATVYVLTYSVCVQPIATSIMFDGAGALWDVDPASFDVDFEQGFLVEHMGRRRLWRLLPPAAVFVVCNAVVGSVVWVIAAFAAVAVCSGKAPRTFRELVCKARSPLVVAAVANVAATACVSAIAASALAMVYFLHERFLPALVVVDVVFFSVVYAAHRCVDFVCAVGVVVAAEEPGCDGVAARGAGARGGGVVRAGDAGRGRRRVAVLRGGGRRERGVVCSARVGVRGRVRRGAGGVRVRGYRVLLRVQAAMQGGGFAAQQ